MAAAPFDTLKLARALRDRAGFSQEHAEATADALAEVVAGQVATKQDIGNLQTEMQAEFASVRTEMDALRTEMRNEFATVRAEFRTEIASVRAEILAAEQRTIIRLGGMLVVFTGIMPAAKFFG